MKGNYNIILQNKIRNVFQISELSQWTLFTHRNCWSSSTEHSDNITL